MAGACPVGYPFWNRIPLLGFVFKGLPLPPDPKPEDPGPGACCQLLWLPRSRQEGAEVPQTTVFAWLLAAGMPKTMVFAWVLTAGMPTTMVFAWCLAAGMPKTTVFAWC